MNDQIWQKHNYGKKSAIKIKKNQVIANSNVYSGDVKELMQKNFLNKKKS